MIHVRYDISLPVIGRYSGKRKEIIINPRFTTPLQMPFKLFHEYVHHILDMVQAPIVLDKILDYMTYGYRYFSSFKKYRKCRRSEVMFRIFEVEFKKLGLEFSGIQDGYALFGFKKELSEKEFKKKEKKFYYIWGLQKEAMRLEEIRKKKLEARMKKLE